MELDDLRFNDRDVERILDLARKREKDRIEAIDTTYNSATTYQDLMKVTTERRLNPEAVREIVESKEYKQNRVYQAVKDNTIQFFTMSIAGFLGVVLLRSVGRDTNLDPNLIDYLEWGAAITASSDTVEFFIKKGFKGDIRRTLSDDIGTFAGGSLGCFLASIAYNS